MCNCANRDDEMKAKLKEWIGLVERELDRLVPVRENPQKSIYCAMRYSLLAGGKRIRPVLALAIGEILGADERAVLPFACALEMIHTYSLIHDDLPAMDDDDLRRGLPTCHVQFGEANAILAGDALLNKAFEVMSSSAIELVKKGIISAEAALRIISIASELAGTEGMIGGQVVDLESEGKSVSEAVLHHIHVCKTGALLKIPAYIAVEAARGIGDFEAEYTEYEKMLIRYTEIIGLAFQIKDDILDVEGDEAVLGKPVGSDEKENKTTTVTLFGLEKCKEMLENMNKEAVGICEKFGEKGEFLSWLALFLLAREY